MDDSRPRVAVIGGGWAGLAAAVRLAKAGLPCRLFEASRTLGGRARRVPWKLIDGREIALDNGQHILIGAYRETLALLRELGLDPEDAFERTPLHLIGANGLRLEASMQNAPWHLLAMIVTARGIGIDERWAIASFMLRAKKIDWSLDVDRSVTELLKSWHQPDPLVHKVWAPLCIAALNTPVDGSSAQVFLNVLRDTLGAAARDSDLLLPRIDLGGLLPDTARRFLEGRPGAASNAASTVTSTISLATRVQNLLVDDDGVSVASGTATDLGEPERFAAAVVATPPSEAARLLAPMALRDARYRTIVATCEGFAFQPIVTVYLLYRDPPRWPSRMLLLDAAPHVDHFGQWAFDRSERIDESTGMPTPANGTGLVAVVISADGAHRDIEGKDLIAAVARQMAAECGMPSRPLDARIIVEKRATFACAPSLARPDGSTPHARLVLAGDYVADADRSTHYPATLEAAVIGGRRAADALLETVGRASAAA